jgi:ketosteroid isomerase-like protein
MSALDIVRTQLENWNTGDFNAIFETFDPKIVVRTDPSWPEPVFYGAEQAQTLWHSNRENMGLGRITIEEEHDLGDRVLVRVNQEVHSPSGVLGDYSYSMLSTVRRGKVVFVEFWLDDTQLRAELGL